MDAGYKTPWIAKKTLDDGKAPILPDTRYTGNRERYKPWEYICDPANVRTPIPVEEYLDIQPQTGKEIVQIVPVTKT